MLCMICVIVPNLAGSAIADGIHSPAQKSPLSEHCCLFLPMEQPKGEKLRVLRPWGSFYYLATVAEVREMIRSGKARPYGPKKQLLGCILHAGPDRPHAGTKYTHNREVSDSWVDRDGIVHHRHPLDGNVRGVHTLKRLSGYDRELFRSVERSCLVGS